MYFAFNEAHSFKRILKGVHGDHIYVIHPLLWEAGSGYETSFLLSKFTWQGLEQAA